MSLLHFERTIAQFATEMSQLLYNKTTNVQAGTTAFVLTFHQTHQVTPLSYQNRTISSSIKLH